VKSRNTRRSRHERFVTRRDGIDLATMPVCFGTVARSARRNPTRSVVTGMSGGIGRWLSAQRGAAPPITPATPHAGTDLDAREGIMIMVFGIALFSILNAVVKDEARVFPANQITFFRNALALPALIAIIAATGGIRQVRTHQIWRHVTHGATMTISIVAAFIGFSVMPLAEANAISFLRPLIVTALAAPLLGERVTALSWFAVSAGFVGVLVIAQPDSGHVDEGVIYAVISAFIGALNMLQQRRLSLAETTIGIVFWYMALSSFMLLPTLFIWWVPPTPGQLAGLIGMGLASGVCQYVTIRPMYYARASTLAPVSYTSMIWAILIGFLWFGDVPTTTVMLGSAIVLAATALALRAGGKVR
jgi:drug/metabolite transporter (DMT)-like permease